MLGKLFAALAILGGFAALFFSIPIIRTPEYMVLLAIAAFTFAAALAAWQGVGIMEEYLEEKLKQ